MKLISAAEAAEKLGVHITRVQVLIREGRLPAQKVGGSYVINDSDLKLVKDRKPGRPPKQRANGKSENLSSKSRKMRDGK
jgi:excisionase family DNA binding protein